MTRRAGCAAFVAVLLLTSQQVRQKAAAFSRPAHPALPERLADTGLYADGGRSVVADRNRLFAPQYPLWSDGAGKRRWVYLPKGTTIDASGDRWDFPVGTRFWKEFSFAGRKIETRFLWKVSAREWLAASYVWYDAETDAVLAPEDGIPGLVEIAPGRRHSIPSRADCAACHGAARKPLGFNALQLSTDRDPNAIHREPLTGGMLTLETLVQEQLLTPADPALVRNPPRIAASHPQTRAMLGYLSANCGTCHNGSVDISALVPSLKDTDVMTDGDAVARGLLRHPSRWQAPGGADGSTVLIDPERPDSSAILARMRSRRPSSQMPPLGTVIQDQQAVDAIGRWIASIAQNPF